MYLQSLATALPSEAYTQKKCWEIARQSSAVKQLQRRSQLILQAVLRDESIATRHFAVEDVTTIFDRTPDQLNEMFRTEAPRLAGAALKPALDAARLRATDVDVLIVCTCTGYLCPGVSSYLAERLGMRADVFLQDLVGLGCAAAIPTLRTARGMLAAQPDAVVACVAVEVSSAAFYIDDDPGVLVSGCLFGDGAAATIWRNKPGPLGLRCGDFVSRHEPEHRDRIRFETRNGRLRNLLHPAVPALAAEAVSGLFEYERNRADVRRIGQIIAHAGGRDVIDALERALPGFELEATRRVLRRCGNMSSPSVLFALEEALREGQPDKESDWWLVSFGAGFSAHGCRIGA